MRDVITCGWNREVQGNPVEVVRGEVLMLSSDLQPWEADTFGSVRRKIKELTSELDRLRKRSNRIGPDHLEPIGGRQKHILFSPKSKQEKEEKLD